MASPDRQILELWGSSREAAGSFSCNPELKDYRELGNSREAARSFFLRLRIERFSSSGEAPGRPPVAFVRPRIARFSNAGEAPRRPLDALRATPNRKVIGRWGNSREATGGYWEGSDKAPGVSFFVTTQWIYMRVAGVPGRAGSQMFIGTAEEPLRCTVNFIES